jgi:hypothetical protein
MSNRRMKFGRLLCTLSGDDYSIIIQCKDKSIQYRFMAIGGFVSAIFVLCFISCYFTFTKLIQNRFIGIPIGLFFAYMITNIYLLLLYTLSKNSFPSRKDKAAQIFSLSIRVAFISFIAVVVSKPLETMIYSEVLKNEIKVYKQDRIIEYKRSTITYFNEETKNLKLIVEQQRMLYTDTVNSQIRNYKELLRKKERKKDELIASMIHLVGNSNYYVQSIVILNTKYRNCWLITLFIVMIFLFPAYLKKFLGETSSFYETKRTIENRLVKEEYATFKLKYNSLYRVRLNMSVSFSETFTDAPFNTIRKSKEQSFLEEFDLISEIYNG